MIYSFYDPKLCESHSTLSLFLFLAICLPRFIYFQFSTPTKSPNRNRNSLSDIRSLRPASDSCHFEAILKLSNSSKPSSYEVILIEQNEICFPVFNRHLFALLRSPSTESRKFPLKVPSESRVRFVNIFHNNIYNSGKFRVN